MQTQELSAVLCQLLNGQALETKQHEAFMLLTVTPEHWPHVAMISVGEVVAVSPTELCLCLWPGTTTTGNLLRTGQATLVVVYEGKANYIQLACERLPDLATAKHPRERFTARVVHFRADVAKYAAITSGVQIELNDSEAVLTRWRETIEELGQSYDASSQEKSREK